jgi:hypothetical protein
MSKKPQAANLPVEASNLFSRVWGTSERPTDLSHPKNPVQLVGKWNMKLYGPDGELKDARDGFNVITTNGLEFMSSFLNSAATAASTFTMRYLAIGTDATGESSSDSSLGTELSRHTGVVSNNSNGVFEIKATFATGSGVGAIVEYGIFDSNTAGTMWARDTESAINKGSNDVLEVTAQITLS